MARSYVVTKGRGSVKHIAANAAGKTLCGIASGATAKAAGPGTLRAICAACAKQAK